jgi:agmatine deiminase
VSFHVPGSEFQIPNSEFANNPHSVLTPRPGSPAALGYRFPAEWEPHEATWVAWPRRLATWPGAFEPIPAVWRDLIVTLAQFEPVHVLAGGEAVWAQATAMVGGTPNVMLHNIVTNDAWARDFGPMFLAGSEGLPPALVDWEYNAWGGKYPPFDSDNAVPRQIAQLTGRQRLAPGIILEGGAVDGNGAGTILTTEACLLNPNRNPRLAQAEIEQYLADYCTARKVIWLGGGIVGDDTDGHVDELARFVGPSTVLAAVESDPLDENYAPLQDNLRRLRAATDADGRPLEVIPVELPRALFHGPQRLPASYMNFYIANGVVIVPQFDDPADLTVCETLARLFPDRQIRGLSAIDLIVGRGAYHCITQQQGAS